MNKPPRPYNPHRIARVTRWAIAMLAWLAALLFSEGATPHRRRIRQRYGLLSLHWAHRLIRALAIVRAVELSGIAARPPASTRNAAPAGFRRRVRRRATLRAIFGVRARKALRARNPRERIQLLLAALTDIDGFARRYLVLRALKRLTKLCAVIMTAPPAQTVRALATPRLSAADTS